MISSVAEFVSTSVISNYRSKIPSVFKELAIIVERSGQEFSISV